MSTNLLASVLLATAMFATADSGSSAAQQLAKGIYAQDTTGDLDEAIRFYRQVLASSPQRPQAAQAQYRLAQSLLQKGDLGGAAAEFQTLATSYPEYRDLIASLSRRLEGYPAGSKVSRGRLDVAQGGSAPTGSYRHRLTGIEIPVFEGWRIQGDSESSGDGEMVYISDSVSGATGFVWVKPYDGAGNIDAELWNDLAAKRNLRPADWKVRPETSRRSVITGEQALSAAADYGENGRKMVEHLVWIRNAKARLLFSMRIPAEDFAANEPRFDRFISRVKLP